MKEANVMRDLFECDNKQDPILEKNSNIDDCTKKIDQTLFLKGVRFCLMGNFKSRKTALKQRIKDLGGSEYIDLAKSVNVIVKGSNVSTKELHELDRLNYDGFFFPIISESDLLDMLDGRNKNCNFSEVVKNIDITYNFIFNSKASKLKEISKNGINHILGCREIFVYKVNGNKFIFWQLIGNLAGAATERFDPSTTDYIMLNDSTISALKNGQKDELIQIITKTYNESKADKFTYKFILESDFIKFIKSRSELIDDDITLNLIEKYETY